MSNKTTQNKTLKAVAAKIVLGTDLPENKTIDPRSPFKGVQDPDEAIQIKVVELIEKYYNLTGVPLSFTVTPSRVCYRQIWSHRVDGEPVYILEAIQNPTYPEQQNTKLWKKVVECIAMDLKKQYNQSTITIQYSEAEVKYLKYDEGGITGDIQD